MSIFDRIRALFSGDARREIDDGPLAVSSANVPSKPDSDAVAKTKTDLAAEHLIGQPSARKAQAKKRGKR